MNRRSFFASLLAAPAAAMAALKAKPKPPLTVEAVTEGLKRADYYRMERPLGYSARCCFNCRRWYAHPYGDRWLPNGVRAESALRPVQGFDGGELRLSLPRQIHLCDDCIEAIQNCATCGKPLFRLESSTIIRYFVDNGEVPRPPSPAFCQMWNGVPRVDLRADQLIYGKVSRLGRLRLSPAGEPVVLSRAQTCGLAPHPPFGRDLIVADCSECAQSRGRSMRAHWMAVPRMPRA